MGLLKSLFGMGSASSKPIEATDEDFDEMVLKSELPSVVDFWSPTCAPCVVMGGLLRDLVPEYAGKANIIKVNVQENPATASRFRVRSIPTLIFVKQGKVVDQQVGLVPLNNLREKLNRIVS